LEFLGAAKGRSNVAVADELTLQICKQRHPLIGRQSEFPVINFMSHFNSTFPADGRD
jgi:hypothetical protein